MHYTRELLDELVAEGWAQCVVDEGTGYSYYMAASGPSFVQSQMMNEAIASCELDRDGTYTIG